jgi:hypothetical protein
VNAQSPSVENPFAGQGSVLLDIGGDIGALVVTMPDGMAGTEVEIRLVGTEDAGSHDRDHQHPHDHGHPHDHDHNHPRGHHRGHHGDHHPDHLVHVAVVERPVADGRVPSLVFPELVAGGYELFEKGDGQHVVLQARISGGQVTSLAWPT